MKQYLAPINMIGRYLCAIFLLLSIMAGGAKAQSGGETYYTSQEIIDAGHSFFGSTSGALAKLVEKAFGSYGQPNGYVLGQEASGAVVGGLTYGEGVLYTKMLASIQLFGKALQSALTMVAKVHAQ